MVCYLSASGDLNTGIITFLFVKKSLTLKIWLLFSDENGELTGQVNGLRNNNDNLLPKAWPYETVL